MSDQISKNDMEKKLNPYADGSKSFKVSIKSATGNPVEFEKLTNLMRSKNGLTQLEAGKLLYGSEENYKSIDPNGSRTRGKIRDAWRSIDPEKEVSVAHTRSDAGQVYFIVESQNYPYWFKEYSKFGEKLDTSKGNKNNPEVIKNLKRS